jgi:hypothetical protein
MNARKSLLAMLLALSILLPFGATTAQAAQPGVAVPVTGTAADGSRFVGSLNIQRFTTVNNQLAAVGTLTGTLTTTAGTVIGNVIQTVTLLVNSAATQASCQILHLELGPLDLNLLGLMVHLDKVVLDISAQPGAGNLLGNLLCAVANLLNGGGALSQIVTLLNQILAQL